MKHKAQLVALGTAVLVSLGASPALAEGSWSSYLNKVGIGFESRNWTDADIDQAPTTVSLSGCSVSGTSFASTGITLYQTVVPFIWYNNLGKINNYCNKISWGQGLGAGEYHFTIETINGSLNTSRTLSANAVVTGY